MTEAGLLVATRGPRGGAERTATNQRSAKRTGPLAERNVGTGDLAATTEIVSVYFGLATRSSTTLPAPLRARLETFLVVE